jgi:hypothetical protein
VDEANLLAPNAPVSHRMRMRVRATPTPVTQVNGTNKLMTQIRDAAHSDSMGLDSSRLMLRVAPHGWSVYVAGLSMWLDLGPRNGPHGAFEMFDLFL